MSETRTLELVAATLSEIQSSLEDHLQTAVDLINEAEEVERLRRVDESFAADLPNLQLLPSGRVDIELLKARRAELHESIVARTRKLREQTKDLNTAAQLERDLLVELREQLNEVKRNRSASLRHRGLGV